MMSHRHLLRASVPCLLLALAPLSSHCGEAVSDGSESPGDSSDGSCEALEVTLGQTLIEVFENSDNECSYDFDCTSALLRSASSCYRGCESSVVARAGVAAANAQGEIETAEVCSALEACQRQAPAACDDPIGIRTFACEAGRCVRVDPTRLTCDDFGIPAAARRTQLRDQADKACARDADCALANISASCLNQCGRDADAVAVSAAAALEASIRDEVDIPYCAPALAYGCEAPSDDCVPPVGTATAICDAGACAVRYVDSSASGQP